LPFEDTLVATSGGQKCKTCKFIDLVRASDSGLADEIVIAIGKPVYSNSMLAAGLLKVAGVDRVLVPAEGAIRNHRRAGHA
jgi:hypothetical protein